MKRRLTALFVALTLTLGTFGNTFANTKNDTQNQKDEICVSINGMYVTFDEMPFMLNNRVLVPLRGIFEILGATVTYDDAAKKITATKKKSNVEIVLDDENAIVNGENVTLDVPPTLVNDRTFVPIRFVSEALGSTVDWNDETQTVDIQMVLSSKKYVFDDMEKIEPNVNYTVGGSYNVNKISLSDKYDHTDGSGKSVELKDIENSNSRFKLTNMFSADDIGKTLTVTAWVYVPNQEANIRVGMFGEKGSEYATSPAKLKSFAVPKDTWTKLEMEYTHEKESATQLGFDQISTKVGVAPLIYVDDVSVSQVEAANFEDASAITGVYTSYESLKSRKKTPGYEMNFDDKDELVAGKDFITGGGYLAKNVSLSDKDHTTGNGKSMKIENLGSSSHRVKLMNVFSDVDLKKYYKISFWVYLEGSETGEPSSVRIGFYGDQGLSNAASTNGTTALDVEQDKWVYFEAKAVHENPLSTQLGIFQAGKISPIMYIDDIKLEEYTILDNGRRKVPTSTLTSTSDPYDLHYYENKVANKLSFDELPEGRVVYDTDRFLKSTLHTTGDFGEAKLVDVEGMPFDKAIQVTTVNGPPTAYSIQLELGNLPEGSYEENDVMLIKVMMRTLFAENEDSNGSIQLICENYGANNNKCCNSTFTTEEGAGWKIGYFPYYALYPRLTVRCGYDNQIVEIADYQIINYGKNVDMTLMPVSDDVKALYASLHDKDAQWRKDAIAKIEQIRKGDINVIVKDANGNPIKDANVNVSMYEHEFPFGSAINSNGLRESATDAMLYREYFSQMFNAATSESAHKPQQYYLSETEAEKAKKIVKIAKEELGVKYYRGHVLLKDLVEPQLDEFEMPDFSTMTEEQKQIFRQQINTARERYISKGMSDFAGQLCEWDILNETVGRSNLKDVYGVGIYKDWYAIARKYADPGMDLYYNEAKVSSPIFLQLMRDMIAADVDFQGIGMECHMRTQSPQVIMKMFDNVIESAPGKKLAVTEFDNNEVDPELQAAFLRDFMIIAFSYEEVEKFLVWGFNDKSHWLKNAPIFYPDWTLKPCGEQFVDLVYNKWWTQENGVTNENGTYSVRGYYGDYDIKVTLPDGREKTVTKQCYKNSNNTVEFIF